MSFNRFFLVIQFVVLLVPLGLIYLIGLAVLTTVQLQEGEILLTLFSVFLLAPFLVAAFRILGCAIRSAESPSPFMYYCSWCQRDNAS